MIEIYALQQSITSCWVGAKDHELVELPLEPRTTNSPLFITCTFADPRPFPWSLFDRLGITVRNSAAWPGHRARFELKQETSKAENAK